jgi:excisionase family DNA binding protein
LESPVPANLLANGTVLVDDDLRAQATTAVVEVHDRALAGLTVVLTDGRRVEVGADLGNFLMGILERMIQGPVSVTALPREVTTTVAAELLGISRPTLMKLVASGAIPSRKVGSHTRLATSDVVELREVRDERRAASFEALREVADEIDDAGTDPTR